MGIMKEGVSCYTPVDNALMRRGATVKKVSLRIISNGKIECWNKGKYRRTYKALSNIPTNLAGAHQEENASLVYHCLLDLGYNERKIRK